MLKNVILKFTAIASLLSFPLAIFTYDCHPLRTAAMLGITATYLSLFGWVNLEVLSR